MFTQDPKKKYILFICKANVWRSQIAEGLYNHLHWTWKALSLAGCEARKEKYHWKPSESIIDFMKEYSWIDISNQRIRYLSDVSELILSNIEEVIFLYDPTEYAWCDLECMKDGYSPYEYFLSQNTSIQKYAIPDPFEVGYDWYRMIYDEIYSSIKNIT